MQNGKTVLLLGNVRPTVAITRRLAALGYRVMVTRNQGGLAASSRFMSEVWDDPVSSMDPTFWDHLAVFLESRPDIDIVLPVEEQYVLGLASNRAKLPTDRVYATPADEIVNTCMDKVAMIELCRALDIPSAPSETVETLEGIFEAAERIGFPLVIRPLLTSKPIAGRKAFITMEMSDLARAFTAWPEGHERLIIQRFIRGPRFNVDYAAQKGKTIQAVATQILRTDAYDGTGIDVCGRTVPMPDDLWEYTERMNKKLNYTGVGLIQFMVDRERNEISFLELNPRFNGNNAVPDHAGLELVRLSIELAVDPDQQERVVISQGGLRHAWSFGDLQGIAKSAKRGMLRPAKIPGALLRAVVDGVTADFHVIWSWRDPMPGITQFTRAITRLRARKA